MLKENCKGLLNYGNAIAKADLYKTRFGATGSKRNAIAVEQEGSFFRPYFNFIFAI